MATATQHTPENQAPPAPPKPEPRRRRSTAPPRQAASFEPDPAEDLEEATPELKSSLKLNTEEDFWNQLKNIEPDHWPNILMYLYRLTPIIDRRANGRPSNIGKYTTCIDQERVKLDHGSGGYQLHVTYRDPVTGKYKRIGLFNFDIMDLNYPPRVPPGDWVDDPSNETWKWAGPMLAKEQATRETRAMVGPDANEIFNTVLNAVEKLRPQNDGKGDAMAAAVVQGMTEMQKLMLQLADPSKQFHMIKEMLTAMQPKESGESGLLMKMLIEDRARQADELKELRNLLMTQQKQPGILEQLASAMPQLENVAKLIGFKKNGAAASDSTDWGSVAEKAIDKLAPLANLFMTGKGAGPGMPSDRGFLPGGPMQHAATPAAEGTPATEQPADDRQRLMAIWQEFQGILTQIAPTLIDKFRSIDDTGYDFRDWFLQKYGEYNWSTLKQKVSIPDFVALAQQHPQLREALSPPEDFADFLAEVFTIPGDEPPEALREQAAN